MKDVKSYGKVTVGYGTKDQKELDVVEFLQAEYHDMRLVTISVLNDDVKSMVATVENPLSTGRNPQSSIWLSQESMFALVSTYFLFLTMRGVDVKSMIEKSISKDVLDFSYSDGLDVEKLK